jgi:hypothetical protein
MSISKHKFGRIVVDDTGISKHKWLFFGKGFQMTWGDLEAFAVSEMVLASQATGEEKILNQTLELHTTATMEIVEKPETSGHFDDLVAHLRKRCPEKEKQSLLAMYKSLSRGPDAINVLLGQFGDVIHAELERLRREFPQPTKEDYAAMFKLISQRVAAAKNLSARHANQIVSWYCEKHAPDILQAIRKPTEGTLA